MTHFALEHWTDYLRDLVDIPTRRAMTAHLEEGCAECADRLTAVSRLAETVAWDATHQPSPEVLGRVYALAGRLPRPVPGGLARLIAQLRFDSRTHAVPAGVRSAGSGMRQMVFEADRFQVHVHWERGSADGRIAMVGRISTHTGTMPASIPVRALGEVTSALTTTNEFGEFVIECPWSPSLRLLLPLQSDGVQIEVPLATVEAAPPAPNEPR